MRTALIVLCFALLIVSCGENSQENTISNTPNSTQTPIATPKIKKEPCAPKGYWLAGCGSEVKKYWTEKKTMLKGTLAITMGSQSMQGKIESLATKMSIREKVSDIKETEYRMIDDERVRMAMDGQPLVDNIKDKIFHNCVIEYNKKGARWELSRKDAVPTEKQKKELKELSRVPVENIFPKKFLQIGGSWELKDKDVQSMFGGMVMLGFRGCGHFVLSNVEMYQKQQCARVDFEVSGEGKIFGENDEELQMQISVVGVMYKNLKNKLTISNESEGKKQ